MSIAAERRTRGGATMWGSVRWTPFENVRYVFPMMRFAAILMLVCAGCDRLDEFDVTRSTTAVIPGAPGGGAAGPITGFGTIDLGGEQALRDDGIDPGDIDSARLRAMRLEVRSGTTLERWLDDVAIRARADGLPDVTIAERDGIGAMPPGTAALDLDVASGVDLKPYLTAPSAALYVEATGSPPETETTIEITATVRVDVNVSGLF